VTSVVSSASVGTKYSRRYRTKSKNSAVDEALFGNSKPKYQPDPLPHPDQGLWKPKKKKPETIQLITKDLIRKCRIPSEDPSGLTVVLQRNKFVQLKQSARVRTREELEKISNQMRKEKLTAMEASEQRKVEMKEREQNRRANAKLNDLEQEAQDKANYLLKKANDQLLENEQEIKGINGMILNAKCHAIRDAQLLEKQAISNLTQDENLRLDTMMELDRINAIKAAEDIEEMKKKQRYLGAQQLLKQIESNAQERVLEEERKDQETKQVLKKLEELHEEDIRDLALKRDKMLALRADIDIINQQQQRNRERHAEAEKLAEFKIMQFQKDKDEREAAYEAQQLQLKKEKELEVARLRGLQEKALDHQAEQDALKARRNQEEAEREWRKKERRDAMKKMENDAMMRKARLEQVENKEHFMAVQALRERDEFERVLTEQKIQIAADRKREEDLKAARYMNADYVRGQIRDKEQIQLNSRKKHFEEGTRMEEEARLRRVKLQEVKNKKLVELRDAGIPLKYCLEIERKIHHPHSGLMPAI